MPRLIHAAIAVFACLASTAHAALPAGTHAPDFTTEASLAGKARSFNLSQALQRGTVVLYFYPSAYTNGCNIQAHAFAERYDAFVAAGATVIGVSLDSIGRLNEFSKDPAYCASKLTVASDADGHIAQAYALDVRTAVPGRKDTRGELIDHGFAERTTFIITPDGKIAATVGGLAPEENVEQALKTVQALHTAAPATR